MADKATALTIVGGDHLAQSSYHPEYGTQIPAGLFYIEAAEGTVSPTVTAKGEEFFCIADDLSRQGRLTNHAACLTLTGGSAFADPTPYLAENGTCYEYMTGYQWNILSEDAAFSDEFLSFLNNDRQLVVERYRPEEEEDINWLYEALGTQYEWIDEGTPLAFYRQTYDLDDATIYASLLDPDTHQIMETHKIPLLFVYDEERRQDILATVAQFPTGTENEDGDYLPYYFPITDLELINYWMTCTEEKENINALINFSGEFKKYIGYRNFKFDTRAGDGGPFFTLAFGPSEFSYNGVVYGTKLLGVRTDHVLYVANETENTAEALLAAAQKRVDDYLGADKVALTALGTVEDYLLREHYENTRDQWAEWKEDASFEEWKAEYPNVPVFEDAGLQEEMGNPSITVDSLCVSATINGTERLLLIQRNTAQMTDAPTYRNVDAGTDVTVTTQESSLPLDTMVEVEAMTEGEAYDAVMEALELEDGETFDIGLHSSSLDEHITQLESGEFEVSIPVPDRFEEDALTVYYVTAEGSVEEHPVTVTDGLATFVTDHFSIYTLAPASALMGDVNGDGGVNVTDALWVLQNITGKISLNQSQKAVADVNRDEVITVQDALIILQYITGKYPAL